MAFRLFFATHTELIQSLYSLQNRIYSTYRNTHFKMTTKARQDVRDDEMGRVEQIGTSYYPSRRRKKENKKEENPRKPLTEWRNQNNDHLYYYTRRSCVLPHSVAFVPYSNVSIIHSRSLSTGCPEKKK
jgi:hypothetical protein